MPLKTNSIDNALIPYKEHPLVIVKPPLAQIPLDQKGIKEKLITVARAVRAVSFGVRAAIVGISGSLFLYEKFKADEAPEIIKDFCYQETGKSNLKIRIQEGEATSFAVMFNTLYVTKSSRYPEDSLESVLKNEALLKAKQKKYQDTNSWLQKKADVKAQILKQEEIIKTLPTAFDSIDYDDAIFSLRDLTRKLRKLENWPFKKERHEEALDKNRKQLNLFKGILDHEMGHLNHYDRYRLPILLGGSFIGMEYFWSNVRPHLESNFKVSTPLGPSMIKNAALLSSRWFIKLAAPTALYTGAFFAARQLAKKTIEAQADASVRDDLDVLTAVEQDFRERALIEARWTSDSVVMKTLSQFFDSHPPHEKRANYFAHRINLLKNKELNSEEHTLVPKR